MQFANQVGTSVNNSLTISTQVGFSISKGVNVSHWLSQTTAVWEDDYITEADIVRIKQLGFDHIRVPIDEHELWNEDGLIIGRAFLMLKKCLDWCLKHSIRVVLVLKKMRNFNSQFHENDTAILWHDLLVQEVFFKMWRNISDFLKDYPKNLLAYELLNEPNAPSNEEWNSFLQIALHSIRTREPERVIFLGSNDRQSESELVHLQYPADDQNLALSFKFFKPLGLTHYRAEWTPMVSYTGGVKYPGAVFSRESLRLCIELSDESLFKFIQDEKLLDFWDIDTFRAILAPIVAHASAHNTPLYCSQFGCLPSVPDDIRTQYLTDIVRVFDEFNIAYCLWDYKGRFGVLKNSVSGKLEPDKCIVEALSCERGGSEMLSVANF